MRAAVNRTYGPPSVVHIEDLPDPVPGAGEVLIALGATTVNRTDCGLRGANPWLVRLFTGLRGPRDIVNGGEFAGQIAALGTGATRFEVGQRVFGYSEARLGAHATLLVMPADGPIAATPAGIDDHVAAASTEASHYALDTLRQAGVRREHAVLVNGATGAIGSAAVQLLHGRGVHVTAVCETAHLDLVRALGADVVIDRSITDFTADERVYDIVFDAVGKSSFAACRRLLSPRGTYLSTDLGPRAQNPLLSVVTKVSPGRRAMMTIPPKRDRAFVELMAAEMAAGRFRPVIDRTFPLDEIVAAYEFVETGQKVGNVVIRIESS